MTAPEARPEVAVVTGLSGAGLSTAAHCLEDLGWYVVDNLPPALLGPLVDLARDRAAPTRIAVVLDVRGIPLSAAEASDPLRLPEALAAPDVALRVLYLEAADAVLVRRYEHVRRPHPLQDGGLLTDGIARERVLLEQLRSGADLVLDTSDLNVHQLRARIDHAFAGPSDPALRATVVSFGYKWGLPVDADLVVDVRFLPNPHWDPELRPFTGLDAGVRDAVLGHREAQEFLELERRVLAVLAQGYQREGKRFLTLAVGCTGGRHRSVAMAARLSQLLAEDGVQVRTVHRDVGRE